MNTYIDYFNDLFGLSGTFFNYLPTFFVYASTCFYSQVYRSNLSICRLYLNWSYLDYLNSHVNLSTFDLVRQPFITCSSGTASIRLAKNIAPQHSPTCCLLCSIQEIWNYSSIDQSCNSHSISTPTRLLCAYRLG